MKILEFFSKYPDEKSCKSAFKKCREKEGVICKKCRGTEHYWLKKKELYECKKVSFQNEFEKWYSYGKQQTAFPILVHSYAFDDCNKKEYFSP